MLGVLAVFFFFNDTATTEIYTLSLHDALPISIPGVAFPGNITGNASGSAGSVAAGNVTGCCVAISAGGTGAADAATARSNLGTNDAGNITTGTLSWARLPNSGVTAGTYTWGTV